MSHILNFNDLKCTLIYDIECVPKYKSYQQLENFNPQLAEGWIAEANNIRKNRKTLQSEGMTDGELFEEYGGLYPEFAKVVSISAGVFDELTKEKQVFYLRTYSMDDEAELLHKFSQFLKNARNKKKGLVLGGHNIKIYDNPMLAKRYAIHGMKIPKELFHVGKKPWEINDVDIAEKWQLGSFDKLVKLDIMCGMFGIESSKKEMDGSEVAEVFYDNKGLSIEGRLEMIGNYCKEDVIATANVFVAFSGVERNVEVIEF